MISGPKIRAFALPTILLCLSACVVWGCGDASRKANARLRREVHDLKQEVARLELLESERATQLAQAGSVRPDLDEEVLVSTPMVTGIGMSTWSGQLDRSEDIPTVEIFVSAVDGRNRPLQMVGTLTARAMFIPPEGEPVDLGERTLTPSQVRDAW